MQRKLNGDDVVRALPEVSFWFPAMGGEWKFAAE
jgi:hypothetical protein